MRLRANRFMCYGEKRRSGDDDVHLMVSWLNANLCGCKLEKYFMDTKKLRRMPARLVKPDSAVLHNVSSPE